MDVISQIEIILDSEYGKLPKIYKDTFWNRAKNIFSAGVTPLNLIPDLKFTFSNTNDGVYISENQCILYNPNKSHERLEFVLGHEHMHHYINLRNPRIDRGRDKAGDTLELLYWQRLAPFSRPKVDMQELEKGMVYNCIDEGLADYIPATAMMKQDKSEGFSYDHDILAEFQTEKWQWQMAHGRKAKELTPLDSSLVDKPLQHWNAISQDSGITGSKIKLYRALSDFEKKKYVYGYMSMRFIFKDEIDGIGPKVNELINNPPKTFAELTGRASM